MAYKIANTFFLCYTYRRLKIVFKEKQMKYELAKKEKNIVELEVSLTPDEWKKEVDDAYNRTKDKYTVEGFRKGKVPRKVIENMYGPNVFYEDALSEAFGKAYDEVLKKEKDLDPIDAPSLSVKKLDDKGVVILAKIPVMPEVKLGKYKGLGIHVEPKKVTDKDVKAELEHAQMHHARLVEKDGAVEMGDVADINFEGFIDGVAFQGGKAENYELEIGSKQFIDTFEEQLVGVKAGETKDVNVKFPDNYQAEELKGKPAKFVVTVNAVKKKELPAIDDAFASDVSEFETLAEYKKHIKEHLEQHAVENAKIETENKIIDAIVKDIKVELPDSLVEHELDHIMQDMEYRLMYQGLKLEDYANYINKTVDEIRKDRKKDAEKSLKIRLAMQQILKEEKIDVTKEDVDAKIKELAKSAQKTIKEYKEGLTDERINYIKNDLLMDKLLNFLVENNK